MKKILALFIFLFIITFSVSSCTDENKSREGDITEEIEAPKEVQIDNIQYDNIEIDDNNLIDLR